MKLSRIAVSLIGCLLAVVVALVLVAIVNGITLSGDLTYGDLLVGLGTFALAVLTAVLADATFGVDTRAADRQEEQRQRRLRGVARLIDGELQVADESWRKAAKDEAWQSFLQLPHEAWDSDAPLILESVPQSDAVILVQLYTHMKAFEQELSLSFVNGPVVNVDEGSLTQLEHKALRPLLDGGRTIIERLAYSDS